MEEIGNIDVSLHVAGILCPYSKSSSLVRTILELSLVGRTYAAEAHRRGNLFSLSM